MKNIEIRSSQKSSLAPFLIDKGFQVQVQDSILIIEREDDETVYLTGDETSLFFQVDLGSAQDLTNDFMYSLLDLNTDIMPVSVAIDSTDKNDPRLVLVDGLFGPHYDENEILGTLDALSLAVDKISSQIQNFINNN